MQIRESASSSHPKWEKKETLSNVLFLVTLGRIVWLLHFSCDIWIMVMIVMSIWLWGEHRYWKWRQENQNHCVSRHNNIRNKDVDSLSLFLLHLIRSIIIFQALISTVLYCLRDLLVGENRLKSSSTWKSCSTRSSLSIMMMMFSPRVVMITY
jgi:hypothetical protein